MTFNELNLHEKLLRAIEARGYETPTDIQKEAIPIVLSGRDLMASSQTGTGKTAAFVLPALQRFLANPNPKGKGPRVLVLTPTRELAAQIEKDAQQFGRFMRFTFGSVLGGVSYGPQIRLLRNPVDLLVATPGRLLDHMGEGRVDMSRLEVLVLDEADRMLDLGFIDPIMQIASATPKNRQTLLFSATLEGRVRKIAKELLRDPASVQLASNRERHALIRQHICQADDGAHKHRLLTHHLNDTEVAQALIFTATKRGADRLAKKLATQGLMSAALHGDMRQGARNRTVDHMRSGRLRCLVATDVAARGLDINGISHVFNYDLPKVAEDYIHRIGRTGRAGRTGAAISFVGPGDWSSLGDIERLTGQPLERNIVPGLEPQLPEPKKESRDRPRSGRNSKPFRPARNRFAAKRKRGSRRPSFA